MQKVIIYSKKICPYCVAAKRLFTNKNVPFEEIIMDNQPEEYAKLKERTGLMTVPQIFIGDHFVGGYSELAELEERNELDPLLV